VILLLAMSAFFQFSLKFTVVFEFSLLVIKLNYHTFEAEVFL